VKSAVSGVKNVYQFLRHTSGMCHYVCVAGWVERGALMVC